jgi:hypothetical protein
MFYAKQLRWNDVNGTKANGRNYSLDLGASSCQPSVTSSNYSTVVYVKIKEFLLN